MFFSRPRTDIARTIYKRDDGRARNPSSRRSKEQSDVKCGLFQSHLRTKMMI